MIVNKDQASMGKSSMGKSSMGNSSLGKYGSELGARTAPLPSPVHGRRKQAALPWTSPPCLTRTALAIAPRFLPRQRPSGRVEFP